MTGRPGTLQSLPMSGQVIIRGKGKPPVRGQSVSRHGCSCHTPHLILAKRLRSGHTPMSSLSPQTVLEISLGLLIYNNGLKGRRNGTICVLPALSVALHGTSGAMLARGPVAQRQRRICPSRPEGGFCLLPSMRSPGAYGPTLTCTAKNMTGLLSG